MILFAAFPVYGACCSMVRLRPTFVQDAVLSKHAHQGIFYFPYLAITDPPWLILVCLALQFESKSSRAKGIAFHPKRSVRGKLKGGNASQFGSADLDSGLDHGSSFHFTRRLFSYGIIAWVPSLIDSKNTMAPFEASTSTQRSPSSCPRAMTTRLRCGVIRQGGVFSP